jgi:hypothetical protein
LLRAWGPMLERRSDIISPQSQARVSPLAHAEADSALR